MFMWLLRLYTESAFQASPCELQMQDFTEEIFSFLTKPFDRHDRAHNHHKTMSFESPYDFRPMMVKFDF